MLPCGDVQVVEDSGRYYLTAAELDSPTPGSALYDVAQRLITLVNGLARTQNPAFVPVELTGAYDHHGAVTVVLPTARVTVRAHPLVAVVTSPDGVSQPHPLAAEPDYLALAASNADVAEVLEIMGQPGPPHFQQLYKVYEIIEHVGDLRVAAQSAGILQGELSLFTRTANHQNASGTESRHARSNQQPPKDPMPIGRARSMISDLITAWLSLLKSRTAP